MTNLTLKSVRYKRVWLYFYFLISYFKVLIFNGNDIPFMDWNVFGIVYDREVFEVIDMSNNKIQVHLKKIMQQ